MTEENTSPQEERIISKHDFYFETPLYNVITTERLEKDLFQGDVDAYNSDGAFDTTYRIETSHIGYHDNDYKGFYCVLLTCKRNETDTLRFFVFKQDDFVFKLGQYPSLADIQYAELGKKYDKVLPKEDLKNLKKAIGLAAHGAGAGSFVYLRRIFENLIFETFESNVESLHIDEAVFRDKRMEGKIELLKEFLPSQLLEMKSIYRILSRGVHELSEEECIRYFVPLKLSIELILDQKIDESKKRERDENVKKQLQYIHQELTTSQQKTETE